jgi:hypothetical protein
MIAAMPVTSPPLRAQRILPGTPNGARVSLSGPREATRRGAGTLLRAAVLALLCAALSATARGQTDEQDGLASAAASGKAAPSRSVTRRKAAAPKAKPAPAAPSAAPPQATAAPPAPRHFPQDQSAPAKPPLADLSPPDTSTPPPKLPPATREKMHACAAQWTRLKLETHGTLPMWREFAAGCLTR